MCPPVPPAAIINRIVPGSSFDGLTRDGQENTDGCEADRQRRTAGADERQRDAGDRQERDDDTDVDERLDAEPGRDAGRQEGSEGVRRGEGDPEPTVAD